MPKYLVNGYLPDENGDPVAGDYLPISAPTAEDAIAQFRQIVNPPDDWVVQANQIQ